MQSTDPSNLPSIDFCIPFIGCGLRYTEFLISNLLSTAAHPERISISLSAHSQNDVDLIKNSSFNHLVKRIVMAHAYTAPRGDSKRGENFAIEGVISSANHCSAIQSLFEQASANVVIFSDHDMAFLSCGWDSKIIEILNHHDVCGVGYPNLTFPVIYTEFPDLQLISRSYQKTPNLSFLAITQKCMERYFPGGMSSFHHFLSNGCLHFQIVNTPEMADALHLPLGAAWSMDSGFEIPFVIQKHNLRYKTFIPVEFKKQSVFAPTEFIDSAQSTFWQLPDFLPEVFCHDIVGVVEPFIAHYRSGTFKSTHKSDNTESFDKFMEAVNNYLGNR